VFQYSEHQFLPGGRTKSASRKRPKPRSARPKETEDLPFKVELWKRDRSAVEQVLAIAANASIGYSAFYAAARDYFDRDITLRHKNTIVNRWNGSPH
jgi:hypothetical protein